MPTNNRNLGTVLITGASSGIGRELALEFGARAATLVLVARRLDRLEHLRVQLLGRHPGLKVVVLAADLSDEHETGRLLTKVFEQAGAVDVLVNNAGLGDSVLFDRAEWARTRQVLRTNIFAMAQLTSALVPGMVERRRGGVLNIGSGAGLVIMPNAAAYVGSKHFVAGFSEALRAEMARFGIDVLVVCPGLTDTNFSKNMLEQKALVQLDHMRGMTSEQVARATLRTIERGKNEITLSLKAKLIALVSRFFPRLADRIAARKVRSLFQAEREARQQQRAAAAALAEARQDKVPETVSQK